MEQTITRPTASLLELVQEVLGGELVQVEEILQRELLTGNPYVCDILTHISRFRGKRLRPVLLLLSAQACGGITPEHRVLAAVVEMIHLATLIHDDVLDEAVTRRHVVTVNARWNNETSVLFGDYLFTHAFHLASSLDTTFACRVIGRATNRLCEGELTQTRERGNLDLTEERYFSIIDGKTAELTALCGLLGAHFARADAEIVQALELFGRKLGLAFQIADDVLDLVGEETYTGKSLGTDLAKQKMTLPVIYLLQRLNEPELRDVRRWLMHPDAQTRRKLLPLLERTHALRDAQRCAQRLAQEARSLTEILPASRGRRILGELALFAVQREF
ncbi:MAG: polyprenyl synthetase [Planctomycetaceae bacterium]|nr:MAG: polyprenyl synthetase [Planctomycetaceae bacterium]